MCGACGRTVVIDSALGPVRNLRQQLLVAQTVNALCSGLSGLPTVQVAGDGWMLRGATGASTSCSTVQVVWDTLVESCVGLYGSTRPIVERLLSAENQTPNEVAASVIKAGLRIHNQGPVKLSSS